MNPKTSAPPKIIVSIIARILSIFFPVLWIPCPIDPDLYPPSTVPFALSYALLHLSEQKS